MTLKLLQKNNMINFCSKCGFKFNKRTKNLTCLNCGTATSNHESIVSPDESSNENVSVETGDINLPKSKKKWYTTWWFWLLILLFFGLISNDKQFRAMLIFPVGIILGYHLFFKENSFFGPALSKFFSSKTGLIFLIILAFLLFIVRMIIAKN